MDVLRKRVVLTLEKRPRRDFGCVNLGASGAGCLLGQN